jgi:hypothetical protein
MHFDGALTDSSANGLTATAAGAAASSSSQSKFGGSSLYLDGSTSYLELADNALFDFGTSDFTLEAWVRFSSLGTSPQNIISKDSTGSRGWALRYAGTTSPRLDFLMFNSVGGFSTKADRWTPEINTWYHIALCRVGTTFSSFVDGVLIGESTHSTMGTLANSTAPLRIGAGAVSTQVYPFAGNIDEVRITSGVARYSSSFAPRATRFPDSRVSTFAIVPGLVNGTAYVLQVAATNAGGTGPYSDSSASVTPQPVPNAPTGLTGTPSDSQVSLSWSAPASNGATITDYVVQASTTGGASWAVVYDGVSTSTSATITGLTNGTAHIFRVAAVGVSGIGAYSTDSASITPSLPPSAPTGVSGVAGNLSVSLSWTPQANNGNSITDYVIQYSNDSGSTWTTFSDGTSTATTATVTGLTNGTAYVFRVAAVSAAGQGDYSSASAAVTPVEPSAVDDPYLTSVSLLLHMNGLNGSTTFTDSSPLALPVSAAGNSQISTAHSRFGGASLLLDGNGDYLEVADNEVFEFGAGDFTLEGWFRFSDATGIIQLCGKDFNGTAGRGFQWRYSAGTGLQLITFSSDSVFATATSAWTPSLNTWYHLAVTRVGTTVLHFVDGVLLGSGSAVATIQNSTAVVRVGAMAYAGSEGYFTGNIDEFRVTRGIARYTATFTALTAPFQDAGSSDPFFASTALLLSMDGANGSTSFPDTSRHARTVTANGAAAVTSSVGKFGQALNGAASTSDFLSFAGFPFGFSTGDFTIELWYMRTTNSFPVSAGGVTFWSPVNHGVGSQYLIAYVQSDNRIVAARYGLEFAASAALTWNLNQWYHIAITRSGGSTFRIFRDGVQVGSGTSTANLPKDLTYRIRPDNPGHHYDEVRVTRGVARYVAGFTPPAAPFPTTAPSASNADAAGWVDRVYDNGGFVSASTAEAVNRFCNAIDAAGLRSKFYRLNLFCGGSNGSAAGLNSCLVPLYRGPSLGGTQYGNALDTNNGPFVSGDYAETGASGGLLGNGTSKYLNTGLAGNVLSATDRHLSAYVAAYSGSRARIGMTSADVVSGDPADRFYLTRVSSSHQFYGGAYYAFGGGGVDSPASYSPTASGGFVLGSRVSSTQAIYENGAQKATAAATSSTLLNLPVFVFAFNDGATSGGSDYAQGFTAERLRGYSIGSGLTDAEAAAFNTAMQDFQRALGRAV